MRHSSIYSGNLEAGIARKSEGKTDIPATIQFRRFAVRVLLSVVVTLSRIPR
jgi:hypothetical protein